MNSVQLFQELGELDEDLVLEAEHYRAAGKKRRRLAAAAAAACILVGAGYMAVTQWGGGPSVLPETGGVKYALTLNRADGQTASSFHIPGHFWEELTAEELKALLPVLPEGAEVTAMANYRGDASIFNIDTRIKTRDGMEAYVQLAPGHAMLDYVLAAEPVISDVSGTQVTAGYFEGNDCIIYFAEFALEDVGYYVEVAGGEPERLFFEKLVKDIVAGGKADFSVLSPVVPQLRDEKLSEREVYEEADFGAYMPQGLQKGFAFEEGVRFINQELDFLSAVWLRGMSQVECRVSEVHEEDWERITSPEELKNYDLSLYPIPRADSVPRELRDIVDDPIFRAEELTPEAVMARAETVADQGDDGGVRMNFSVLYDDNMLVSVRIKGVDPQRVYEALKELPRRN